MFDTKSGIELKIALGNYRMFFTPSQSLNPVSLSHPTDCQADTEDYFHRKRLPAEVVEADVRETTMADGAKERLEAFVSRASEREA